MSIILVNNINCLDADVIIDQNPWWDLNQIRKVVSEDENVAVQLKACRSILCDNFDEPSLADTCLSFLPIKVQIQVAFNNEVLYRISQPLFSLRYSTRNHAIWPIKPFNKICHGLIGGGTIQDSKVSTIMHMMSSGWTIVTWWLERHRYVSMLTDTKGRCRAFYDATNDLGDYLNNGDATILPDFQILTRNREWLKDTFLLRKSEKMVVIDLSDPPPRQKTQWSREHYFWNSILC
jgi:hypothetical protein